MGAVAGLICGLLAAAPLAFELRKENPNMGRGIAAVALSFLFVQVVMLVMHRRWRGELLPFAALYVVSFLIGVVVAVVRRELRR